METVDEFMARFRATGLDMLTEQRRRAEQMFWLSAGGHWSTSRARKEWKAATLYDRYYSNVPRRGLFKDLFTRDEPSWRFITMDSGEVIADVPASPTGRLRFHDYQEKVVQALEQQRSIAVIKGRSCGLSYHRQAAAAAVLGMSLTSLEGRIASLSETFGVANQSLDEWVRSFGVRPLDPAEFRNVVKPWEMKPGRSLGPGKEVEEATHRGFNAKRVAKDRLKRKIAKKSKRR